MKIKNFKIIFFCLALITLFSACAQIKVEPRKYFILEYKAIHEDASLFAKTPHNFSVRVVDSEISSTYNRRQIVVKASENQIIYDYDNLWADRLPNAISNLIHQRVNRYNIFNRVVRDYQQPVKYEIVPKINAFEYLNYGSLYGARLNIELHLRRSSDNIVVFQHNADRNKQIFTDDVEMFVQTINDLIMEETDIFLKALNLKINQIEKGGEFSATALYTSRDFFSDTLRVAYRLEREEEQQIVFMGRLFVPSKTDSDYEPSYIIEDLDENYLGSYRMGTDVLLNPGKYNVFLGNGTIGQKVKEEVEIFARYKTVLEPNIGWLTINIIDDNRNQVDQRYELFDLFSTESYGFGYGIKEGVGQQLETWVLKPGLYKVVLNGMPFNTYSDFVTVEVKKGDLEQLTIVVNETTNRMIGAGRMLQEDLEQGSGRLRVSVLNHLNANFNSKNDIEKNKNNFSLTVIEQLDTKMVFDAYPYHYTLKNLIELGVSKDSDTDLKISSDKFDLKNTLVYYFYKNIGLYARADLNTHLFDEYIHTKDSKYYKKIDKNGNIETEFTDKFQTKKALFPLVLKEGAGLNYRVVNRNRANLNFRAGLGFRQDYNNNSYSFEKTENGIDVYREMDSLTQKGTEFSANGNFQILRDLNYTTNADLLIPFDKNESETFEWENILNLRMFKYISWDYRLNISYNKNVRDYVMVDHSLFLRFTYIFIR